MNIFVLNYLFFGFSAFLISILILLKRWDEVARRWLYFSILVTIWAIYYSFEVDNKNTSEFALYSARVANASSAVIPVAWIYFIYAFLGIKGRKIFWIAFPVAYFLLFSAPNPLFIPQVSPAKGFSHISEPGPIFHFHAVNFFCIVVYGFYLTIRSYLKEDNRDRRQELQSFCLATALGFIGGSSNYSIIYLRDRGIDLTLLLSTFPFLMAYAMIRHRTLDIEKLADIVQREKLAAIGVLSASVNHELKSPLFVARGTLESCIDKIRSGPVADEALKQTMVQAAEKSIKQIDRAMEIMRRLTEFAKPGGCQTYSEKVEVEEALGRVLELVNSQFVFNKIQPIQRVEKNLAIFADQRQFEEILFNLILNACQAMPEGGELGISAEGSNGFVRIEISDTGKGINSSDQKSVFQPFYSTKGKAGTGLGLYITRQLVQRNGGKIRFETSNQGTTFILEFHRQ